MQFYVVYIREAHAIDSDSPLGGEGMPIFEDPSADSVCHSRGGAAKLRNAVFPVPSVERQTTLSAPTRATRSWASTSLARARS